MEYDVAVIGNDEAAFEMLWLSASSSRKTLAVLPDVRHSAWFVGQALRRLVSSLLVDRSQQRRNMFRRAGTPKLLRSLVTRAIIVEVDEYTQKLRSNAVDVMLGEARFVDQRKISVSRSTIQSRCDITATNIVIGTGVRQMAEHRPLGQIPFHHSEALLAGHKLPNSVYIIGGGSFGAGLAALTSLFGVRTQLIAGRNDSSAMLELASAAGVNVGNHPSDVGLAGLETEFSAEQASVVDCRRAVGFTDHLNLDTVNVQPDEHGQLWCANNFETWASGVFGIGKVVGFSTDSALQPADQANRVMDRITHTTKRPHLFGREVPVDHRVAGKRCG